MPYEPYLPHAEKNPAFLALYGSPEFQDAPVSSTYDVPGFGTYVKSSGGGLVYLRPYAGAAPGLTLDLSLVHQPAQLGRLAPLVDVPTQNVPHGVGYVGADGGHPVGGTVSAGAGAGSMSNAASSSSSSEGGWMAMSTSAAGSGVLVLVVLVLIWVIFGRGK